MADTLNELVANIGPHGYLLVPALAFLEACVGIGLFVSGIFLVSTASLIYLQGEVNLALLIALAFSGALLGDHLGFLVGAYAGPALGKKRWVRKQLVRRKEAYRKFQRLLQKSTPWAICLGRLYPATRSLSPVLAGVSNISLSRFFAYDLLACSLWATGLTVIVYTAGQV
ncbi:MAG: DedA family protein [Pseudomonadales bacterium]